MSVLLNTVEAFIRLVRQEVMSSAVLAPPKEIFEVTKTPSLVLQGPTRSLNGSRRSLARVCEKDLDDNTYEVARAPRLYHLDFDVVITTSEQAELLNLEERFTMFLLTNTSLTVGVYGELNLTEIVPVGGAPRVNLSNLRQASGQCRIEDCPVFDDEIIEGKLILKRTFEICNGIETAAPVLETASFTE